MFKSHCRMRSILICGCDCLDGDRVQLTLALVGNLPATFLILLHQSHLLKLLHNVPQDLARALSKDILASATAILTSVDLAEGSDTNTSTDVDLADHGGCAGVD